MNQSESIRLTREATADVPAGARERVWRRLGAPRAQRATPVWIKGLAFAACTAAGFAIFVSLGAPAAPQTFTLPNGVAVARGAVTQSAEGALVIEQGELLVSAWGAPGIKIVAAKTQLEAEAALFSVGVAAQAVIVDVREGSVRINGERVEAGRRWPSGAAAATDLSAVTQLEPARAGEDRAWKLAERAVEAGQYPEALERFDALGGGGLRAEAALLKKGELQLRQLASPADALVTFDLARARFPTGSLGQEVALSSLEAMLALEKWNDVRARSTDFLSRFPQSERQLEVRYVAALAAWQLEDKRAACTELAGLQAAAFTGERRATVEKLTSQCTLFER